MNAARVCPACGRLDPVAQDLPIWPLGWVCPACGYVAPQRDGVPLTASSLADTITGFDPADFEFLARAELHHFWFVARRRLIVALVEKYAPEARSFLEIGCGSGNVIGALARLRGWSRIVGTDIHSRGLLLARKTLAPSVELLQADARSIPFRDAFDLVGAFDVLEHVAEDEAVIAIVRASLVKGGVFLAAVPQHPGLWSAADDVGHHVRRYERRELDRKISAGGFEVVFSTSYAVSLLPLMALSRLAARRSARTDDARTVARREFRVPSRINRLLTIILNLETALTRRGARWPAGGSRVIAARKR